jgi:hypothetical protein
MVIKQKEAVIKKELDRTERVLELEMQILEFRRDADIRTDYISNYQLEIEAFKSKLKL